MWLNIVYWQFKGHFRHQFKVIVTVIKQTNSKTLYSTVYLKAHSEEAHKETTKAYIAALWAPQKLEI